MFRPTEFSRTDMISMMPRKKRAARGYTIVELLVATLLMTIVMLAVVEIFAGVGEGVRNSRATLETFDRVRAAKLRLQRDLDGLTVDPVPPRGEQADGYLEIIEGPVGTGPAMTKPWDVATNDDEGTNDTTVGDFDDILMFTSRNTDTPFVGLYQGNPIESDVAEVAWFLRGRNLYRRVLLVQPRLTVGPAASGFFANNDISVRPNGGGGIMANSLADLARRENRFGHRGGYPHDARIWGAWRLPLLRESAKSGWQACYSTPSGATTMASTDFWNSPDPLMGVGNAVPGDPRPTDDLILTNVIGFDVKVYDPGAGMYVDLGFNPGVNTHFSHLGMPMSGLDASGDQARVYDTWTLSYEGDGIDQFNDGMADLASNGFDDDGNGAVDDVNERETMAPYPVPLRGIQVKIRVFEPDSRQVREVTVGADF